jgi:hypothetical protein
VLNPETAWIVWTLLESTEWKHLPALGGLLDQDEALMIDIGTLSSVSAAVEQMLKDEKKI